MFCDRCGARVDDNQNFCPACGKSLKSTVVAMGAQPRVAGHIRLLGILWLAYSGLHLIPGLFLMTMFQGPASILPPDAPAFVPHLLSAIGVVLSAASVVGLVTGWGLLNWRDWARTLALVLGALNLLNLPFGTAIGVYTLWVLLPETSEQEYRSRAQQLA